MLNKEAFIMQNTGNFNHLCIARFEVSEICYYNIKMPSYKNIITHTFNVCKFLKIQTENGNTLY